MKDLYEILGVGRNASEKQIIGAYRKLASKKHPDIKGGSKAEFEEIKLARDVLVDPDRRRRYDETGQYGDVAPDLTRPKAIQIVAQAFAQSLTAVESSQQLPKNHDLARMVVDNIRSQVQQSNGNRARMETKLIELDDVAARFGDGVLRSILNNRIAEIRTSVAGMADSHRALELALEIAEKETYAWDAPEPMVMVMHPHMGMAQTGSSVFARVA